MTSDVTRTRLTQVVVALAGIAAVIVMLWLGLWQMRVFENAESSSAAERAALPPVPLLDNVTADGTLTGDVYGRQVVVPGRYLPDETLLVPSAAGLRVLTAFQVPDGRVVPVVRGLAPAAEPAPAPPSDEVTLTGVFLPSEPEAEVPAGELGSVRLAALAQLWPRQQLLPGFLTLNADLAAAEGLAATEPVLPTQEDGPWRNAGYALQWWVFAAFAGFMTVRFVRAIGRAGTVDEPADS